MGWSRAGNVHRALLSFSEILSETELVWKEAVGLVPFPSTQPPALTLLWLGLPTWVSQWLVGAEDSVG